MSNKQPVILSKSKHAKLTYKPVVDYSFTAKMNAVPLLVAEVVNAARCFPVVFPNPKNAEPHALLGLGGENIFVNKKGGWSAPYVPLVFGNHPFSLAEARFTEENGEKGVELALAIVEDAPHFRKKDGLPLYTEDGKPSKTLEQIIAAIGNQYRSYQSSVKALEELQASDVLTERIVTVHFDGKERSVGGLRVASREKVFALPDETLGKWVKMGLMEMLLAHWQSMRNLDALMKHPSCPIKSETVH